LLTILFDLPIFLAILLLFRLVGYSYVLLVNQGKLSIISSFGELLILLLFLWFWKEILLFLSILEIFMAVLDIEDTIFKREWNCFFLFSLFHFPFISNAECFRRFLPSFSFRVDNIIRITFNQYFSRFPFYCWISLFDFPFMYIAEWFNFPFMYIAEWFDNNLRYIYYPLSSSLFIVYRLICYLQT
jgi:hypothetical protein